MGRSLPIALGGITINRMWTFSTYFERGSVKIDVFYYELTNNWSFEQPGVIIPTKYNIDLVWKYWYHSSAPHSSSCLHFLLHTTVTNDVAEFGGWWRHNHAAIVGFRITFEMVFLTERPEIVRLYWYMFSLNS